MRLFTKRGIFQIEYQRGKWKSLRTKDEKLAKSLFKELKKEYLRGRLLHLEDFKKISLTDFLNLYIEKAREGISEYSIKKDKLSLKLLAEAIGGSTQLRTITSSKIEDFKRICRSRGAKEITINGYLRHIKAAFTWAIEEGYVDKKPKIKMYRLKADLPFRILKPDEIDKIMKKAEEMDIEYWRYFNFQLWTGARRREGLGLEWTHINFESMECTLSGKTGRRTVPLLPPVIDSLESARKDIGRVFIQYHPDTWSHIFQEVASSCGIAARLHDLRHNCATYLLKNGVPLEVVQKILGHRNINTTQIYAKVLDEMIRVEMQKLKFQ